MQEEGCAQDECDEPCGAKKESRGVYLHVLLLWGKITLPASSRPKATGYAGSTGLLMATDSPEARKQA